MYVAKVIFKDKYEPSYIYHPEDIINWEDRDRIEDCLTRGLIEQREDPAEKKKAGPPKKSKK